MPNPNQDAIRNVASLIGDLSRLLRRNFNRHIRVSGLTQPQWQVIALLRKWEGINQAALAELMDIQPISLARLIDRMEIAGWVERKPDPNDRRAVQLFLTDKAEPVLLDMRHAASIFEEEALAGITIAEREQLFAALDKIKTNLLAAESCSDRATTPQRTQ